MTNFTKKQLAEAQVHIGRSQAALSREKRPVRSKLFPKSERKRKLALGRGAAENIIQGTIKKNRLPRPPAKKR